MIHMREADAQLHDGLRDSLDTEAFRLAHCDDTMLSGSADVVKGKGADALGVTKVPFWFLIAPTERSATCCEYSGALAATTDAYGTNLQNKMPPLKGVQFKETQGSGPGGDKCAVHFPIAPTETHASCCEFPGMLTATTGA